MATEEEIKAAQEAADKTAFDNLSPQDKQMVEMNLMDKPVGKIEEEKSEPEKKDTNPETEKTEAEKQLLNQPPEFDYEKITGGRFKTKDEMENVFTEHETIKKEYEPVKQKVTELETELKAEREKNPFGENETLYKVHKLAQETGRTDYEFLIKVVSTDTNNISDLEALKTIELLENSEIYKGKEGLLDRSLIDQYNLSKPEDFDDLDPVEHQKINDRIEINQIRMAKDAKLAKQKIIDLQSKYKYEKPATVDNEKLQAEKTEKFVNTWRPTTLDIEKNFTSLTLNDGDFDYVIPIREKEDADIRKQVLSEMVGYAFESGFELNDKNVNDIKTLMRQRYFALNEKHIVKKIAEQARAMTDEQWSKIVNNTKPIDSGTQQKEITKTPQDIALEKMNNE